MPRTSRIRRATPSVRLHVESLEERLVPSTLIVTNNSDTGVSGDGSLRGEIAAASSGDTIVFAPNMAGQTITLTSGLLAIDTNLTIQGLGANQVAVSGNHASRVFAISTGVNVTISDLTIEDGKDTTGKGGGISNAGNLTLDQCGVVSNSEVGANGALGAPGGVAQGGGLYSSTGTVTLFEDTFANNIAQGGGGGAGLPGFLGLPGGDGGGGGNGQGGGVFVQSGTVLLINSTMANNHALGGTGGDGGFGSIVTGGNGGSGGNGQGGGVYSAGGTLTFTNDTVAGNQTAAGSGGQGGPGFPNGNPGSNGSVAGGGLDNARGTINLLNTLVATNTAAGSPDIAGSVTSNGHNLIGDGTGSSGLTNGVQGDQVGAALSVINPHLGLLLNNGGPTETMALLAGSPALDAGDNSALGVTGSYDQRGAGYNRLSNSTIDIGAFELQVASVSPPPSPSPSPSPASSAQGINYVSLLFLSEDQFALTMDAIAAMNSSSAAGAHPADNYLIAFNHLLDLVNPALGTGLAGLQAAINANPYFGTSLGNLARTEALGAATLLLGVQ